MKRISPKFILLSILIGILSFVSVLAWTNPSSNPASGTGAIGTDNAPANSIYIDSSGNVGIGTTGPATTLEVEDANSIITIDSTGADSEALIDFTNDAQNWRMGTFGDDDFRIRDVTGGNKDPLFIELGAPDYAFIIKSSGNVGIGTTGPSNYYGVAGSVLEVGSDTASDVATIDAGVHGSNAIELQSWGNSVAAGNIFGESRIDTTALFSSGGTLYVGSNTSDVKIATADVVRMTIDTSGNVGIGTTNPGYKLDLGGGNVGNVGKISVDTIDPIFKIGKEKYATFVPDIIGKKVIVVGQGKLNNGKYEIDLAKQKKASDLWLFYNTVKKDSIIPFVSSQGKASLYGHFSGSKFIVKLVNGKEDASFSYQLIGKRIDSKKDENIVPEPEKATTFIDVGKYKK